MLFQKILKIGPYLDVLIIIIDCFDQLKNVLAGSFRGELSLYMYFDSELPLEQEIKANYSLNYGSRTICFSENTENWTYHVPSYIVSVTPR